ncbi:uncharacterized protein TNCV_3526191 [Trichonephila clavipes]|nr:uncharacterized protein TNCV_3526191 [Trichonephila clavipes]
MTVGKLTEGLNLTKKGLQILESIDSNDERVAAVAEWYGYRTVACIVTGSSPVPLKTRRGSGSNPEEGMDVCKWKVPLRHWGTLKGHRAASPLVRLVEGKERWETPAPQGVLPQNWGGTKLNRTVT